MKVIFDDNFKKSKHQYGIGLGNFDGIHLAHRHLVETLIRNCRRRLLKSMIYTFPNHPAFVLKHKNLKLLTSVEEKIEILNNMQLDALCLRQFDMEFADIDPEEFVVKILVDKYNMKLAVTGFNYFFGRKGKGDIKLLQQLGEEYDFDVVTIPPLKTGKKVISSSAIRDYIKKGDMVSTYEMLGRYYSIKGTVEYGNKIGTEIGFPTANIVPLEDFALPKYGVYYTNTMVDGKLYESITNLGVKPTINKDKRLIIETHLFNFAGFLYGKNIEVMFKKRIRGEIKFSSIEKLKEQILIDIKNVKQLYRGD